MGDGRQIFAGGGDTIRDRFRFAFQGNYSLLLRLVAPLEESESWRIDLFMQSRDDPSTMYAFGGLPPFLIPIAAREAASASKITRKAAGNPRTASLQISAEDAYDFLRNDALALKNAGFNVQIPTGLEDMQRQAPRVNLLLSKSGRLVASPTTGLERGIMEFDYRIALGDVEMSPEEFMAIAQSKVHLVNLRGKWTEVNPEEAARLMKAISSSGRIRDVSGAVALSVRLSEDDIETDFVAQGRRFDSILDAIGRDEAVTGFVRPPGFSGTLRPYQERGVEWLGLLGRLRLGALLADDMGLGKTVQVIAHIASKAGGEAGPTLVICPTSVIGNWIYEFSRFAPKVRVKPHHGAGRSEGATFSREAGECDVVVTSYALAWRDEEEMLSVRWGTVVIDEAQNIKNPFTKQSSRIKGIAADERIALTGTPIENRLSDLWSIMEFLNPGYLPKWSEFKERFAKPIETRMDEKKRAALQRALSPVILRRLKTDKSIIRELPDKIEKLEWCTLTPEQATLYGAVVDSSLEEMEGAQGNDRRMAIFAVITRLKQICNHPANFLNDSRELGERSGKVERLKELLSAKIGNGESCLVFSQYTRMAELLYENLRKEYDAQFSYYHGGLTRRKRDAMIREFQSAGTEPKVMLLSLKAGGVGLNLTNASNVIHFDRWWNPAVEDQATDRAYRIGQGQNVFVHKMVTKGTVEERIEEIISGKKALAGSIIGSGEDILTDLSGSKLRKFLSLRE